MMGRKRFEAKLFHSLSLAKLVPEDHLLRRLDETLDLSFVREDCGAYYSHTGQPSVDPVVIFKMMLLGYLYGISSERRLAEECSLHLAFRWYLGYDLDEKTPDHSVLSKARGRYGREVFERFFQEVLALCVEAGLVGGEVVFADSTLVEANAAQSSIVERERFEPKLGRQEYLEQVFGEPRPDEERRKSAGGGGSAKRGSHNQRYVSNSDPEASIVGRRGWRRSDVAYKQPFTVDGQNRVITAVEVTNGITEDSSQVEKLLQAQPMRPRHFCADTHYGTAPVYGQLEEHGVQAVIPRRGVEGPKSKAGRISHREFRYDERRDVYVCLQGKELRRQNYDRRWDRYNYRALKSECRGCPIRAACSRTDAARVITRPRHQAAAERATRYFNSQQGQRIWRRRKTRAEGIVAEAKVCHGLRRAMFRGLGKVTIQVLLIASVQNLKRLMAAGLTRPDGSDPQWTLRSLWIEICQTVQAFFAGARVPGVS
jgi:transposase